MTVHSLGAQPMPAGVARLEDAAGRLLASARFAALPVPLDFVARRETVKMVVSTAVPAGTRVRLVLDGTPAEVTQLNDSVALAEARRR